MRQRSDTWVKLAARGRFRMESIAIIDGVEYTAISAPVINRALIADNLSVGNCISATLKLSVLTDDVIGKAAKVVIKARITDDIEYSEWLEFGTFYIDNRTVNSGLITMQCYDCMLKARQMYVDDTIADNLLGWPKTMQDCVDEIAARIGVEVDPRTVIKTADPYQVTYPHNLSMMQVLGYIGACHGGNWIITPENKLRLVPLLSPPAETFNIIDHDYNRIYTGDGHKLVWQHTETSETVEHKAGGGIINVPVVVGKIATSKSFAISRVLITRDADVGFGIGDDTGYTLIIESNPYACQAICDDLYAELNGLEYMPYSITSACYDPAAELGDWFLVGDQVRSILYSENATLNVDFRVNASAPGKDEVGSEYPYLNSIDRIQKESQEFVKKYTETEMDIIYSKIEQTYTDILFQVAGNYATKDALSSFIALTEKSITAEVTRATKAEDELASRVKLTEDAITAEVSRSTEADGVMSSQLNIAIGKIELKVDKGALSSEISAEAGQVAIKSNRMVIESDNFALTGTGEVTATGSITTISETENGIFTAALVDGNVRLCHNDTIVGNIQGADSDIFYSTSDTYDPDLNINLLNISTSMHGILISAKPKDSAVGHGNFYLANNGLNPSDYTEPHIFKGDVRFLDTVRTRYVSLEPTPSYPDYLEQPKTLIRWGASEAGDGTDESCAVIQGGLYVIGSFGCEGTKSRVVNTDNYGALRMNAMESASAVFSDMGSGLIDDNGKAYVYFDPRFMEVIDQTFEYQVFITNTAEAGASYVEKSADHFVVYGVPKATFDWLVYARQKDYADDYLEQFYTPDKAEVPTDDSVFNGDDICANVSSEHMDEFVDTYDQQAEVYLKNYELEVTNYGD